MAETGKGVTAGKLAINVQKRLTRAQEKVLQKLGKADETRDAAFEEMVSNFNKQMTEGTKLQRDLKAYLTAVKTMHDASRRLQDCLADMYEPEWFGKEEMDALAEEMIEKEMDNNLEDTDTLWLDYHQSITDKSMSSMDTYLSQFPDIKARIAKRDRKMVDFDSARHHFASLQKGKKKDEAKIAKPAALLEMAAPSWAQGLISAHQVAQTNLSYNQAEEDLGRAQKIFEELNVELQDELPALWDNRVGVYVNTFQSLAGHQEKFHREMSKLSQNLNDIMTKLEEQRQLNEEANHSESASSPPKKPGPPPSRPPPRLTPSPDQRQQHGGLFEDEASGPVESTDPSATTTQQAPSWDSWVRPASCLHHGRTCFHSLLFSVVIMCSEAEESRCSYSFTLNGKIPQRLFSLYFSIFSSKPPSFGFMIPDTTLGPTLNYTRPTSPTHLLLWILDNPPSSHPSTLNPPQCSTTPDLLKQDQAAAEQEPEHDDRRPPEEAQDGWDDDESNAQSYTQSYAQPSWDEAEAAQGQQSWNDDEGYAAQTYAEPDWDEDGAQVGQGGWGNDGEGQSAVTNGSDGELPPGFLYKVKAIHDYAATDNDELELKMGDVVLALAFDNPDEQDDGWLMGVKESHWLQNKDISAKGVFPENFTQKV
ncbi:myc box-dependent-interacting protein 1b isoform X1 [Chaetodon auriga]|uniref:myc box-dependent-interacting protein 1b isoform X1 n=1 Tax=Chaetodon auriga TaxID=39042 RepID=UPI004032B530